MDEKMMEEGEVMQEDDAPSTPECKIEDSAYEKLKQARISVEEIVAKMLSIKKDRQSKSELGELVTQMFLNFVTLRQVNRLILLQEDHVKAETERAKAPVDLTTLQLHNLLYEKNHYLKAIKACKDFKSKHPDIELVPEEEFHRDASESIKGKTMSSDTAQNLMLKRLNYELFQRKELCKLREKLEQHKRSLQDTIANRRKFLSSLPSHLKSLKKASLPVQQLLGVLHTKKLKQHHSAELLPPPLFVIYSQFLAQKEAFGESIDLEIVGSMKDAQSFARQQAIKDPGIATGMDSSRLEDDVPDEDDEGQRRRKRPKKAQPKESLDQAGLYQIHPLKVILHVYDDEVSDPKSSKLATLKFEFLLKLNVVCVGIEGSYDGPENNILCNLFPDDTGLELPHQSAKLSVGDAFSFDERRTSRPYKWAQHVAGIDFLPEVSPLLTSCETSGGETAKTETVISGLSLYRKQNRIQTVVQRIRSRKKAQLALVEQLDLLEKLKWPLLTCESVPWALHTPQCSLHSWLLMGSSSNQTSSLPVIEAEQVVVPLDTDTDGKSGPSKDETGSAREDGELPSLVPVAAATITDDAQLTGSKGSDIEHSRQLALISKSMVLLTKARTQSFNRLDENSDLLLDTESDIDEPRVFESELGNEIGFGEYKMSEMSWVNFGVREFCLVLTRRKDSTEKIIKLEAKIQIGMEYPLRPPLFAVNLFATAGENSTESDSCEWCNEIRAMEAEVNLHILEMLPWDQENNILAHQICCLAMLFDFYIDEASMSSEKRKSTTIVDVGLCKPVTGRLLARSFRGRDRRKMISWKDLECTPAYPY
ncbi:THO complex, subunit 5 [Dillenia turbinata]|uniref:THO complex, subunit 5 n=1 Tax=Dillenia turbinata TaxID=194707 RepID=A0AAN8W175_9MAGN